MKTQIFSLIVALISLTTFTSNAAERISNNEVKKHTIGSFQCMHTNNMVAEQPLTIEAWMYNDFIWGNIATIVTSTMDGNEEKLEIKDWMTDSAMWNVKKHTEHAMHIAKIADQPLRIENWMTDDSMWR